MRIDVDVINQDLLIPPEIKYVVEGTQEFIEFHFNLKSGWEDLTIFAQFIQEGTGYNVFLDENNSACLPPEIVNGYVQIVLYGVYGDIIAVSHFLRLRVQRTPFISDGQSTEITQSLYDQLVTEVTDFETEMNELMATKADKTTVDEISNRVGSLSNLTTTAKANIVAAINEVKAYTDTNKSNIGTLSNLTTTDKSNLVSAINEVNTALNDLGLSVVNGCLCVTYEE